MVQHPIYLKNFPSQFKCDNRFHLTPDSKNKITKWFAHHARSRLGFNHYSYISSLFIHVCQLRFLTAYIRNIFLLNHNIGHHGFYTRCGILFVLNFEVVLFTTHLFISTNWKPEKVYYNISITARGIHPIYKDFRDFSDIFRNSINHNIFRLRNLNQNNQWSLNKLIKCYLTNVFIASRVLYSLMSSMSTMKLSNFFSNTYQFCCLKYHYK